VKALGWSIYPDNEGLLVHQATVEHLSRREVALHSSQRAGLLRMFGRGISCHAGVRRCAAFDAKSN